MLLPFSKYLFLLLWFMALPLVASSLVAQQISYESPTKPVSEILADLSDSYDIFFSYPSELISPLQASLSAENQPIEEVLSTLLDPFDLQAQRSNGSYFFIQRAFRTLRLVIQDGETQEALPYAIVRSLHSQRGVYANEKGVANLLYDAREDSLILIQHFGYLDQTIQLRHPMEQEILLELRPDSVAIEEVRIEYQNSAITLMEGAQFQLDPGSMQVLPGLVESDIMLSLEMLPGLESSNETASGMNVRGGGSDELMVYWDRIPVYKQGHFFGTLTSFIPSTVQGMRAFKNYIPVQYTGAASGLIDIYLPQAVPTHLRAAYRANLTHTDLMVQVPFGHKISLLLAGRVSFHDQFNSPTFSSHRNKLFAGTRQEDFLVNADEDEEEEIPLVTDQISLAYQDLNAKLIYQISSQDYVSVSLMHNQDQFYFDASSAENSFLTERAHEIQFQGANVYYARDWSTRWRSSLSLSYAGYEMENNDLRVFEDSTERNERRIQNTLFNREAKLMTTYQATDRSIFSFGYQFNDYQNFFSLEEELAFEEGDQDTLEAREPFHGIFARYQYSWQDKIDLQPQVRIDYFPGLEQVLVNPVITAHLKVRPSIWLKSSYGHYAQAVRSLREGELDFSNVSEGVWLLSEQGPTPSDGDDLPLIRSRQMSLGFLYQEAGWLIDFDAYWKATQGISSLNQFSRNLDVDFAIGESQAIGLDLMVRKKFGRYQSWMSYSLSKVSNAFIELSQEEFPSSFDRPHQFRWVHNFYLSPLEISLGWTLRSGSPYTQASGLIFIPEDIEDEDDPDIDPDEGFYEIQYGPINGQRLPLYHRLDLSVWYKFVPRTGRFFGQVGLSVQNLYNRENVWQRFFYLEDVDEDRAPEITEEERYFLGFTPNLSLQLNF